jgi:predicted nucleic acid-binding protein
MDVLVDTNVLLRSADPYHPMHQNAIDAVNRLRQRGECPCLVAQNLIEFRAVCTRPAEANGLGMDQLQAKSEIARLKSLFRILPESPNILSKWEQLVDDFGASGKQNHDARIVAAMLVHGITAILAFNKEDFTRYDGIMVVTP